MAFTKALYYPWIDIEDEGWLKNAILYWDHIQTIVPESVNNPYTTRTALKLCDENLLSPYYVNPQIREIHDLTDDVLKYLDSPEGTEVLFAKEIKEYSHIHPAKLAYEVRELIEIHPDKLPDEIQHKLRRSMSSHEKDWLTVDKRFASFYMTLLATRLSSESGLGLLTNTVENNKLANSARLDAKIQLPKSRRYQSRFRDDEQYRNIPASLSQGILVDLILQTIQIDPETPIDEIMKFKKRYADELGNLRVNIAKLTTNISTDQPLSLLYQQVNDIYINEVQPGINILKRTLSEQRIRWVADNFLKVSFFSMGAASLPLAVMGLSVPQALLAGAGISLTASATLYNCDREKTLRENPFSYLFAAEKELKYGWVI
jgi:Family of unknown function (DUF6236)